MTDSEKLDALLKQVGDLDKNVGILVTRFDSQETKVTNLETEIYGQPGEQNSGLKGQVKAVDNKVDKITGYFSVIYGLLITTVNGVIAFFIHKFFGKA